MKFRPTVLWLVMTWVSFAAKHLHAGMGVPIPVEVDYEELPQIRTLTPWFDARLQTLSFFLAALAVVAVVVKWMWNLLQRDWPKLPRMTYRAALMTTGLWALLSIVILTMISGARELMTPGAWKQHGWTYQLADKSSQKSPSSPEMGQAYRLRKRYEGMQRLSAWINSYVEKHQKFPESATEDPVWDVPTFPGQRYVVKVGPKPDGDWNETIAFEPFQEGPVYVLGNDGTIGLIGQEDLRKILNEGLPTPVNPLPVKSLTSPQDSPVQKEL